MKYLDEFRDSQLALPLIDQIRHRSSRRWVLMDVCGGQTHSLVRNGIEQALSETVELIHGPGCPVCVTPIEVIDFAVKLSRQPNTIVASFGDMLRVPGSQSSLIDSRSHGGNVQIVYSPVDAVRLASETPESEVVFLGVGFETTAPATALALLQASRQGLTNFTVVPAHVRVQPAMETMMQEQETRVQGFLAAGHVCVVTGFDSYEDFSRTHQVPVVVTGFEPIDLLQGILACIDCLERREARVVNRYGRNVTRRGNPAAQRIIDEVYEVANRNWRGFGVIRAGGLALRTKWRSFDAYERFSNLIPSEVREDAECRGADVMSGKIKPKQCPAFGTRCTPLSPIGAPMVSSEGACAAYYRFEPIQIAVSETTQ
jgi:hydrogenase expression/formation protein HypD